MKGLTDREKEVVEVVAAGAHSMSAIGAALQPPITPRGAERLVHQIAGKIPEHISESPLIRVIVWARERASGVT